MHGRLILGMDPDDKGTAVDIYKDGAVVCTVELAAIRDGRRAKVAFLAPKDVLILRKNARVFPAKVR